MNGSQSSLKGHRQLLEQTFVPHTFKLYLHLKMLGEVTGRQQTQEEILMEDSVTIFI